MMGVELGRYDGIPDRPLKTWVGHDVWRSQVGNRVLRRWRSFRLGPVLLILWRTRVGFFAGRSS